MLRRTGILLLVVAVLAVGGLASCAGPAGEASYKVGVIASQTGPYSGLGLPALEGMELIADGINENGGIDGIPLELIVYDDKGSSTETALAAKRLIEVDEVLAFACSTATGLSHSLVPVANDLRTPGIIMSGTGLINDQLGEWCFKPIASEDDYIPLPLGYLADDQGVSKLAGLLENSGYGEGGEFYLAKVAPDCGIAIVETQHFDPAASDLTPQLTNIKNSDAEAIFIWGSGPAGALAVKQAREMGISLHIVTTPAQASPSYVESFQEYYEMAPSLVCLDSKLSMWRQLADDDPDKAMCREFDELYIEIYGHSPSMWNAIGAQIIQFIADGLERAEPDPTKLEEARGKVRDAFESTTGLSLFMGTYTLSPTDHYGRVVPKEVLVTFKDGEKVLVKTFS
ncbi:MAG: ABC transporter substrate-binding protein [Dehalococcoidia bacterium]|nr:ABC transporter substrate-binding protein [Dehalococcoidia bacterium]MCK4263283.1 ABC transporter substrate-binding protein [Dehalococcoidia bacterium]